MSRLELAKPVGINHISLEVCNIAEAIEFFGSFLDIQVVYEENEGYPPEERASIDMGDQFIALTRSDRMHIDIDRHFGLVVDDKKRVINRILDLNIPILPGLTLSFLDPWGNRIEVISYQNVMFSKLPSILEKMALPSLEKNEKAVTKMRKKGFKHT